MNQQKIAELEEKIQALSYRQGLFQQELNQLKIELNILKTGKNVSVTTPPIEQPVSPPITPATHIQKTPKINIPKIPKQPSDLEKIIGESWINKIGILILVIGVAIGAKYSIENELISPLTRIVLGYITGIGLLGFGMKLKAKFESYSAVLVSGAMAIFYFITFFAYSFYDLIPQILAFVLMVIFTGFTVFFAIKYERVVIAHIGLVGAYAVPYLVSSGSGRVDIFFSYITIVNLGILFISIKRHWKSLHYSAFAITWLIYSAWFYDKFLDYTEGEYRLLALGFATIFFLMFYAISVFNKINNTDEKSEKINGFLIFINSFLYFGFGYGIFTREIHLEDYLGLFALVNAIIHFGVAYTLKTKKQSPSLTFYLVLGMVFTFITIAIPIQLDGNWVTLLWAAQGFVLYWLAKTKNISMYEKIALPIFVLAFLSLLEDRHSYDFLEETTAFANITFFTGIFVIVVYAVSIYLALKHKKPEENKSIIETIIPFILPFLLGITSYYTFATEISLSFNNLIENSKIEIEKGNFEYNYDLYTFKNLAMTVYTLVFLGGMGLLNHFKFNNKILAIITIITGFVTLLTTQTAGLYNLGELRTDFIEDSSPYFAVGIGYILVRYLLWGGVAFLLFAISKNLNFISEDPKIKLIFRIITLLSILCFISNELVTWLDIAGYQDIFKLGLSILWGVYSLVLISWGIYKQIKYLRVFAIVLFGITLVKLFLYDISDLSTISKTIVLIILGVLLLITSFLYNKFKDKITDNDKN